MEALHILADQFLVKSLTKYFFCICCTVKYFCTVPLIDKKHVSHTLNFMHQKVVTLMLKQLSLIAGEVSFLLRLLSTYV